jgi:alkanesulfonate monooxygenase SsuD/methylene tetrahydromethanopterin reductase-like flavin-dependent oxidoreductase (luciferase family)
MGVGYLEPEMTAIGVPMERRGTRAVEYLGAMRALWEQEHPSFEGEFAGFSGVNAHPRPLQSPLPVVMAGHSPAAHRRAARHADGWYGFMLDLEAAAGQLEGLRDRLAEAGRSFADLEVSITPRRIDAEAVAAFGRLGVDRLVIMPPNRLLDRQAGSSLPALDDFLRAHAPAQLSAAGAA